MATSKRELAEALARQGFWVFQIVDGKKTPPLYKDWQGRATNDWQFLRKEWPADGYNIGISTSKFRNAQALLVVDVDTKNGKDGYAEILRLELEGFDLPETYTQDTPTGGRHLVYFVDAPVRQGTDVLGRGLDIRSRGGYIVAAGSSIGPNTYTGSDVGISRAPQWVIDRCNRTKQRKGEDIPAVAGAESGIIRARHYLRSEAPLAIQGQGGDETTYKVAARLKDFGVYMSVAHDLMLEHWNDRCEPPWDSDALMQKVGNAWDYGTLPQGTDAPEVAFKEPIDLTDKTKKSAEHPFDILNKDHAYTIAGDGDHIIWETTDEQDKPIVKHLAIGTFHRNHAAWKMQVGKRSDPVTQLWFESDRRRAYKGLVFRPEQQCPPQFYNLWRGFSVTPLPSNEVPSKESQHALDAFLGHTLDNVCRGNTELCRWLVGYFAHLVQRPYEKPLVALVFCGGKGVGKNALIERIGALLGSHFLVTADRRYLTGNFNGHLESCLLFALDEAFWSGDKQAEGQLKNLITGQHHVIEHKGKEPFRVENRTRICIISNEEWAIPASADERRFAVFEVGDGRRQDRNFFEGMRVGMEAGGYRVLLRYLLSYDLTGFDVNDAPKTKALLDQKHASQDPFCQWWLDSIHEGRIKCSDFETAWPEQVECERFRAACQRYARDHHINKWAPSTIVVGKTLRKICPGIHPSKRREGNGFINTYKLPNLEQCRLEWEAYVGQPVEWPK